MSQPALPLRPADDSLRKHIRYGSIAAGILLFGWRLGGYRRDR